MEASILLKLDFSLTAATSCAFLAQFLVLADDVNVDGAGIEFLAHYLCELALQDYSCLRFLPSAIAASAVCLARICLCTQPHWSEPLAKCTQYTGEQLRPCVLEMHALFRRAATSNLRATKEKYASKRRLEVSSITPPPVLPPL